MPDPIRILIAEDEGLIRDALSTLLGLEDDLEVLAALDRGDTALTRLRQGDVAVAVLDNHLPGLTGLEIAETLAAEAHSPAVIFVSGQARPEDLRRALKAGVLGFCTKGISATQLAETIRAVHAGRRYIDPDLAALAISAEANPLRLPGQGVHRDRAVLGDS